MLTIQPKHKPTTLLEVFQITPERLAGLTDAKIQQLPIRHGNRKCHLSDHFIVSGDARDLHLNWIGDFSNVAGIGHRMNKGWIQIDGNVGNHLGSRMSGGTIQVSGDTGSYAGAEMTGGLIHVKGNAGSSPGAAYDGGRAGQNGGAILIEGSANNLVGKSMRRGLIAIGGDVKACCGFAMRAGTIIVFGSAGKNAGLEMTRGTIVLINKPDSLSAGFAAAGPQPMPVTRMLNKYLSEIGFPKSIPNQPFQVYHGDPSRGGRGELLIGL